MNIKTLGIAVIVLLVVIIAGGYFLFSPYKSFEIIQLRYHYGKYQKR